jgi:multiple antibiotic resistance protein
MALVKDFSFARQKQIMLREGFFVFILTLIFQFFGAYVLSLLKIDSPALSLCGGILVFMVALRMIFPPKPNSKLQGPAEPFIVPITIPLLAGPGTLTVIMLTAANEPQTLVVTGAIALACTGVMIVLMTAPYLQKLIGKKGLQVLEQVMGMILALMSTEMMLRGLAGFIKSF